MNMLNFIQQNAKPTVLTLIAFFLFSTGDISGQISRRPSSNSVKKQEKKQESETRLTGDVKIGNLDFFGDLYLAAKANVGYKLADYLSAGLGFKVFYTQIFISAAPDRKLTDMGGFLYARGKIFENFFLQAEYNYTSFSEIRGSLPGESLTYTSLGAGYVSGRGNWKMGAEINFHLNERARDYQGSVVEYWFGAFYNF